MNTSETYSPERIVVDTQNDFEVLDTQVALDAMTAAVEHWRALAQTDTLTTLQNQVSWKTSIESRMQENKPFGIFLLDMDKFKSVNDTLSHADGDEILKGFGKYLKNKFMRQDDTVQQPYTQTPDNISDINTGRLGGDEFAIAISLSGNDRRGDNVGERMDETWNYLQASLDEFSARQDIKITKLGFGISFGGAVWDPEEPVDFDTLYRQADESLREAKPVNSR